MRLGNFLDPQVNILGKIEEKDDCLQLIDCTEVQKECLKAHKI